MFILMLLRRTLVSFLRIRQGEGVLTVMIGATAHAIKAAGGEKQWVCPLMDANRGFRTSAQRLGNVKE